VPLPEQLEAEFSGAQVGIPRPPFIGLLRAGTGSRLSVPVALPQRWLSHEVLEMPTREPDRCEIL